MKKKTQITPRGAVQPCVDECAAAGEAAVAVNVRECDEALRVVGQEPTVDNIEAGRRLLLADGDRLLTLDGQRVMLGGQVLLTLDGELVGVHRVGDIVVVATTAGLHWLRRTATSYVPVTLDGACPRITLSALEVDTLSAAMEALTFDTPYTVWPATLATGDVAHLTTRLRQAWAQTQQSIDAAGALGGMVQVRCGVRLMDDTYLWLSEPVTLGSMTLADAARVVTDTTLDGTAVTGIPATTITRHRYRVGITVEQGIDDSWLPLVQAIDILATTCASPVVASHRHRGQRAPATAGVRSAGSGPGSHRQRAGTVGVARGGHNERPGEPERAPLGERRGGHDERGGHAGRDELCGDA